MLIPDPRAKGGNSSIHRIDKKYKLLLKKKSRPKNQAAFLVNC